MKIALLVRSLDYGGAQRQAVMLAEDLARRGVELVVMTFYSGGLLEADLVRTGVRRIALAKNGRWDLFRFFWRLLRAVRRSRPDVLVGYLDGPNLTALALKCFVPGLKVAWSIRSAFTDPADYDWLARVTYAAIPRLARFVDVVTVNSEAGRRYHCGRGLPRRKTVVLVNGVDTRRFAPDPQAGRRMRVRWGIPAQALLLGLVARFDPIKDHETFLRAASIVAGLRREVHFVCVGDGPARRRVRLERLARVLGLDRRLSWVGTCADMPAAYNALDLLVLASYGEGFPNVVAEAMACGVPCVVTDVGDAARIVGATGQVVAPRDPDALARGCVAMIRRMEREGARIAHRSRARIQAYYARELAAEAAHRLFVRLAHGSTASHG